MDRQPECNEPWANKTTHLVQSSRLHRRPRVSLKTINIIVEDEHEEENEEQMWFDPDEFDCHDPSFFAARGRMEEVLKMDVDDTEEGNSSRSDLNSVMGRPQKRIIWGEEVPLTAAIGERQFPDDSFGPSSYVMTMGVNPLITIRPVLKGDETGGLAVSKEEAIIFNPNSASGVVPSHRVLELDQLRNYFQLTAPESGSYGFDSVYQVKSRFFLSLLDPSMPRLTNCGNYYRMRYAVYVMPKRAANRSMFQGNWRNRAAGRGYTTARADYEQPQQEDGVQASGGTVLHIGEMHLYTIFPKDGGKQRVSGGREWIPQWCLERPDYIHYENISFFLNQTALSGEEQSALRATETDVNQMVQHFRRFLKHLNSTYVSSTVSAAITNPHEVSYNSTFLLEQLKYPKAGEHFTNPDRVCEQFVRNQMDMFARYQVNFREQAEVAAAVASLVSSELPNDSQMATACSVPSEVYPKESAASKDCLTMDLFLAKLHRLRNQAEWKSVEA